MHVEFLRLLLIAATTSCVQAISGVGHDWSREGSHRELNSNPSGPCDDLPEPCKDSVYPIDIPGEDDNYFFDSTTETCVHDDCGSDSISLAPSCDSLVESCSNDIHAIDIPGESDDDEITLISAASWPHPQVAAFDLDQSQLILSDGFARLEIVAEHD